MSMTFQLSEVEQKTQSAADLERDLVVDRTELPDQALLRNGLDVLAFCVADLVEP